ncbi:lysophospholipase II [Hypoxylon crocopeplum]|nr:lysophospholipase II [Hypoxylon crocopeplum]
MVRNTTFRTKPEGPHTHTVIFLHGRDSDGKTFASEFFESEASEPANELRTLLDLFPSIRWVVPTAPTLHSERFETECPQWFDMWSVEHPEERPELQQSGLQQSIEQILTIIKEEESLVARSKIFLCGISQGFATAIATFLAEKKGGFAGLIGLSSWMACAPGTQELEKLQAIFGFGQALELDECPTGKTPVFLSHSVDDEVVPINNGRVLRDTITSNGFQVEWHEYEDGGHWVNEPQGVDDIVGFLKRCMATSQPQP